MGSSSASSPSRGDAAGSDRGAGSRGAEDRRLVLLEINNALISHLRCEPLFRATTEALKRILTFERASLVLLEEGGRGRVAAYSGTHSAHEPVPVGSYVDIRMPVDGSSPRSVIKHDLAVDGDGSVDARLLQVGIRSYVTLPLVTARTVIGFLNVASVEPDRYQETDVELLHEFAHQLALAVENMLAYERLEQLTRRLSSENAYLAEEITRAAAFGDIIGCSPALQRSLRKIELVAPTEAIVLILGESGTGKEMVAHEVHRRSRRASGPLIRVNCAAVPHELFESEFFGHVRGAFTGAVRHRVGRFELADGGSLLLDEVGEIPLELQGKLLRVIQEGQFERVGEERTRSVDVRIIAATNRDLRAAVAAGRFREDLFYRLNVFPVALAPLRERREDIPMLAEHFLALAANRLGRPAPRLTAAHVAALQAYDWPGNIRELQNVVERAAITFQGGELLFDVAVTAPARAPATPPVPATREPEIVPDSEMQRRVRDNMRAALARCGGKIYGPDGAAQLLGLPPTTLSNRIRRLGLDKELNG